VGFNKAVSPVGFNKAVSAVGSDQTVEATVVEELPSLVFRLELKNKALVFGHAAGGAERNWVRLLPGDRVEVELSERDLTRGRILKKIG